METLKYISLKWVLKNFGSIPVFCLWEWKPIRKLLIKFTAHTSTIAEASHMIIELQKQNLFWPRNLLFITKVYKLDALSISRLFHVG
jgi:hypothetical protein